MEKAGLRVMAAASRDIDPASFDPNGDLLAYVEGLQMTSLVGMVDPPREESEAGRQRRAERPHPRADGDRRRCRDRSGDRRAVGD